MMFQPTLNQTLRAAQAEIERHAHARQAPRVIWAGLEEDAAQFAARIVEMRKTWMGRILAAVPYGFEVPQGIQAVPFAPKMFWLLHPSTPSRYRVGSGGRGSGKSHAFAAAIILRMLDRRLRVLCAREIMRSLRESVHHLLEAKIETLDLSQFFEVNDREITCRTTGAEIIFAGLFANINALKSLENISLVWLEEAESVSQRSLEVLTPTIRAPSSELWSSMNPDAADAPVMEFVNGGRPDVRHVHVIFSDNAWWLAELESERIYLQSVDPDAYAHIYLGATRTQSDAQIFKGKYSIEEFVPQAGWNGPFFGADFGFSQDAATLIKLWISGRVLYVEHEAYAVGVDIHRLPHFYDSVPDARLYTIRADCSRPETISYLNGHEYRNVVACTKWTGCAEDGIAHIRSYERVVIHPRCTHTADEFRLYSYKVDRLTGDVLPDIVGKHDHTIDAIRYALQPRIQRRRAAEFTYSDWSYR